MADLDVLTRCLPDAPRAGRQPGCAYWTATLVEGPAGRVAHRICGTVSSLWCAGYWFPAQKSKVCLG